MAGRPKKKTRGRPRIDPAKVYETVVKVRLIRGEDDDLIEIFEKTAPGKLWPTVKLAMRGGIGTISFDDVEEDDDDFIPDFLDVM